jgi:hypothetical protein
MRTIIYSALLTVLFISGCSLPDPEENAIKDLFESFVASIDKGDEVLGKACLLNETGFKELNPTVSERADGDVFTEVELAELFYNYRALLDEYTGRDVKFIDFTIGNLWAQHKGRRAFENNLIRISVNGSESVLSVRGIAKIGDKWKIVELSNAEGN